MIKENVKVLIQFFLLLLFLAFVEYKAISLSIKTNVVKNIINDNSEMKENSQIVISFVGDCTLGIGANYSYSGSLNNRYDIVRNDAYFFGGVKDILANDTFTIANLEGVLSDNATRLNPKEYNYKGPSKYANILVEGSVEVVNLANNHTYDYLQKGYDDTINALNKYKVLYVGYNNYQIIETNGIRIGIVGLEGWDYGTAKRNIDTAMNYFKDMNVSATIFNFHWGKMRVYNHNNTQSSIAKYAIDKGATIVVGHHPHVLQEIEKYKGKYIAYSLGNFVYGGIYYPYDSDTVILQLKLDVENNKIIKENINVIPAVMTSSGKVNDYRPKVVSGKQANRIYQKLHFYN